MPYNTRRKSLSLPSLGIHIPVTHAARVAAAAKASSRATSSPTSSASPSSAASTSPPRSSSPESHPSKRQKRAHSGASTEQTPPPSPTPATSVEPSDAEAKPKVDLEGINDDIVEAVIVQLQSTGNRPHLIKELATILSLRLTSVQNSANPCAIISSRLSSYMKRPCWSAIARCPLAKELEPVHPRRTYFFLTTYPRQPLPENSILPLPTSASLVTPSVSLTDDSGSDDVENRRRDLSPSPEIDLSPPDFEEMDDDVAMPATPISQLPPFAVRRQRDLLQGSPPLEKDEREFTQTADGLQKRKLMEALPPSELSDRPFGADFNYRDDIWFAESRSGAATTFLTSPAMKPLRKDEEGESWLTFNKLYEWDKGAESIEIDELDCLLDAC